MDSSVSHPSIVILIKRLDVMQGHFLDTSNTWRSRASTWHQRSGPQNRLPTIGERCKLYITSSDDDLSEIESANSQAFVYASCQLPAPKLLPEFQGQYSESDSATESNSEDVHTISDITEPEASHFLPLPASIPVKEPQERLDQPTACRPFDISNFNEESTLVSPS